MTSPSPSDPQSPLSGPRPGEGGTLSLEEQRRIRLREAARKVITKHKVKYKPTQPRTR